jgi:hypothetical protein|tara:strand:- start:119177 stop:119479 length:303 start_codon:yes stop_codon:yes gene_type:complete
MVIIFGDVRLLNQERKDHAIVKTYEHIMVEQIDLNKQFIAHMEVDTTISIEIMDERYVAKGDMSKFIKGVNQRIEENKVWQTNATEQFNKLSPPAQTTTQ